MSWTSHDQFFGFVHSFRLNRNNYIFGGRHGTNSTPYHAIVNRPTFTQVVSNWNTADTGLLTTFFVLGLLVARRRANADAITESIIERRGDFKRYHRLLVALGLSMALRNSSYRLQGYVPNGLPKKEAELVKYDYTSEIINNTFWKYFVELVDKPQNL